MALRNRFFLFYLLLCCLSLTAQDKAIDLTNYELTVRPNLTRETIKATAELGFFCRFTTQNISLLLRDELEVSGVSSKGRNCNYHQSNNKLEITLAENWTAGTQQRLTITFSGMPPVSSNPSWEAGFYWSLDHKDRSWMTVSPYRADVAAWLPYPIMDRADSTIVNIILPDRLMGVSNGVLVDSEETERARQLQHTFLNTVPCYPAEIQLGVGYYHTYDTLFRNIDGEELEIHHYVQDYNLQRATKHFQQTADCYSAWEYYLGKPPFSNKAMTLIEVPFNGGPSAGLIRYGNRFMRGSYGGFIPRNMNWDHELVRSTAGQYISQRFGYPAENDRWLPIGINTYLEALYVEFHFSKQAALNYLEIYRPYIRERQPLIDPLASDFDLNDGPFQAKSALVFHTIRQGFNDDGGWITLLRDWFSIGENHGKETETFINLLNERSPRKWDAVLEQYLHHRQTPTLLLRQSKAAQNSEEDIIECRYAAQVDGFDLPVQLNYKGNTFTLEPETDKWKEFVRGSNINLDDFELLDANVLVVIELAQ